MTNRNLTLLFFLFVLISVGSCKDDPCDAVLCQNNGVCVDGDCDCPPGFEGDQCELMSSQRITGNYDVTYNCVGDTAETQVWGITADASSNNEVIIMEFHRQQLWVRATITDPNSLELIEVVGGPPGYSVFGSGTIEDEDRLSFEYTLIRDSPADTTICSVIAVR